MFEAGYYLSKIKSKLKRNDKEVINIFFRKHGVKIGGNICCNILTPKSFLIEIKIILQLVTELTLRLMTTTFQKFRRIQSICLER